MSLSRRQVGRLLAVLLSAATAAAGQTVAPGAREIWLLNFGNLPVGDFPNRPDLRTQSSLEVVDKDGVRMLKAGTRSEFLIRLPEVLPEAFTLEFDLVPKEEGSLEDLWFGSTTTSAAEIIWSPTTQRVGEFQATSNLGTTRGQLTKILASFEGNTFKLYTNGVRLYTLTDLRFVRGQDLRVFLGGANDENGAVYLARVRVAEGIAAPIVTAALASNTGTGMLSAPAIIPTSPPPTLPTSQLPASTAAPSGVNNPVTDARVALFASPPQRSIRLTGFAGNGVPPPPSRRIALTGFAGAGAPPNLSRTVRLPGLAGVGGWEVPSPRTTRLTGFTGVGNALELRTTSRVVVTEVPPPPPRTIPLAPFTGAGSTVPVAARSIRLAGFTGTGEVTAPAARRITLPGFSGSGGTGDVVSRVSRLSGWTGVGPTTTP